MEGILKIQFLCSSEKLFVCVHVYVQVSKRSLNLLNLIQSDLTSKTSPDLLTVLFLSCDRSLTLSLVVILFALLWFHLISYPLFSFHPFSPAGLLPNTIFSTSLCHSMLFCNDFFLTQTHSLLVPSNIYILIN